MEITVSYLFKSAMVLLALYLFYYALLRNQNSFAFNRLYLLLAPLVALGLPLLKWPVALAPENAIGEALQAIQLREVTVTGYGAQKYAKSESILLSPALLAGIVYSLGAGFILLKLIKQLVQVRAVKAAAAVAATQPDGIKVYKLRAHLPTFAFGSNIFLGKQEHLSQTDQEQVLAHELAHVRLRHTWDVLYYEILSAILWANPVIWLLKQELRDVHEYQADARVANSYQTNAYSSLLSKEALLNMGLPIGSYFQKPQVLKRLQMLQQSGQRSGWFRQVLVLPFIASLVVVFSVQQVDAQTGILTELTQELNTVTGRGASTKDQFIQEAQPVAEIRKEPAQPKENKVIEATPATGTAKTPDTEITSGSSKAEKPYTYVEQMPTFKGGETELMKYLARNIRYPKSSQEAGTSGLVVVSFIVEKDGALKDVQVLKPVDESIDAEAVRVVESMNGNWQPGLQNGIPVQVRYTLPVRFTLK